MALYERSVIYMITNNGIQMLKLMHLRKVLTAFEPIAGNIGEANKNALKLIDVTNADIYDKTMEVSEQYLQSLVAVGAMAKMALDGLALYDKI